MLADNHHRDTSSPSQTDPPLLLHEGHHSSSFHPFGVRCVMLTPMLFLLSGLYLSPLLVLFLLGGVFIPCIAGLVLFSLVVGNLSQSWF